jgi:hypothetical protein
MRRLVFALLILCFAPELPAQDAAGEKKIQSITKQWHYMEGTGGDEETLTISPMAIRGRLSGPGLPDEGVEMEKKVAKIVPSPSHKDGIIIVGPDSTLSQPYQAIHWYDLKIDEVKLFANPRVYPSVEAAEKESKCELKMSKTYRTAKPQN